MEDLTDRMVSILDNITYWDTCPDEYKTDIKKYLQEREAKIKNMGERSEPPYPLLSDVCDDIGDLNNMLLIIYDRYNEFDHDDIYIKIESVLKEFTRKIRKYKLYHKDIDGQ